jgi:hypothetical protein
MSVSARGAGSTRRPFDENRCYDRLTRLEQILWYDTSRVYVPTGSFVVNSQYVQDLLTPLLTERDPGAPPTVAEVLTRKCSKDMEDLCSYLDALEKGGVDGVPRSFMCPIGQHAMRIPVVAADGHSYERASILEWFDRGSDNSPISNLPVESKTLVYNYALASSMDEWFQSYRSRVIRVRHETHRSTNNETPYVDQTLRFIRTSAD